MSPSEKPPLVKIIEMTSVTSVASSLGISRNSVYKWLKKGYNPADRSAALAALSDGKISEFQLMQAIPQKGIKGKAA